MIILTPIYAYSDSNKHIHRVGSESYGKKITLLPADTADTFEEVDEIPRFTKAEYEAKVAELVRERYTADEEFALQRKRINSLLTHAPISDEAAETLVTEYDAYNSYVEECKVKAVEILNNPQPEAEAE